MKKIAWVLSVACIAGAHAESFRDCPTCPEMVNVPAGSFTMGTDGRPGLDPAHVVNLPAFAIGKFEVTQGEWKAFMGGNPSKFAECGDACPVERVTWPEAQEFLKRLSAKTGKAYRLPSEAQWEYACRAGQQTDWCGGNESDKVRVGRRRIRQHPSGRPEAGQRLGPLRHERQCLGMDAGLRASRTTRARPPTAPPGKTPVNARAACCAAAPG